MSRNYDTNLMYEYELILLGKKNSFAPYFFNYNAEYNEKNALVVIRYAIEDFSFAFPHINESYLSYYIISKVENFS